MISASLEDLEGLEDLGGAEDREDFEDREGFKDLEDLEELEVAAGGPSFEDVENTHVSVGVAKSRASSNFDLAYKINEDWDYEYDYEGEPDELVEAIPLEVAKGRLVFARVLELMDSDENESTDYAVYHRIQTHHNYVLGHYFRTLYQILELVDEHFGAERYEEATRYTSIIRAQLSANELILLFYNCSYRLVDGGEFRRLINLYEIFEHMPLVFMPASGVVLTPGYSFDLGRHIHQYLRLKDDGSEGLSNNGAFGENRTAIKFSEFLRGKMRKGAQVDVQ